MRLSGYQKFLTKNSVSDHLEVIFVNLRNQSKAGVSKLKWEHSKEKMCSLAGLTEKFFTFWQKSRFGHF